MSALARLRSTVLGPPQHNDYGEEQTVIEQAVSVALTPLRVATSRPAIKAYLVTLLFLSFSSILIFISTAIYSVFYYNYVPQINLEKKIWLQYDAGVHPRATVSLQTNALVSQTPYDVDIVLHMPRTPSNVGAGNFMVDLSLLVDTSNSNPPLSYVVPNSTFLADQTTVQRSRRSAILPYTSHITSLTHTLLHLPIHLLSLKDLDSSTLVIPMFEQVSFKRGRPNIPTHAYVEIQSQTPLSPEGYQSSSANTSPSIHLFPPSPASQPGSIQIYDAKIVFRARFKGLRYIIYNYRIVSFLLFTTIFYLISLTSMAMAWTIFSAAMWTKKSMSKSDSTRLKIEASSDGMSTSKSKAQGKIKSEAEIDNEQRTLYNIKTEEDDGLAIDSSDAAAEARSGALITDHHLDAEDEEEEEDEILASFEPIAEDPTAVKDENEGRSERFADSGLGTSMESEVAGSGAGGSGLVRRRSGRRNG